MAWSVVKWINDLLFYLLSVFALAYGLLFVSTCVSIVIYAGLVLLARLCGK